MNQFTVLKTLPFQILHSFVHDDLVWLIELVKAASEKIPLDAPEPS
jgi:hypothetical protein